MWKKGTGLPPQENPSNKSMGAEETQGALGDGVGLVGQ